MEPSQNPIARRSRVMITDALLALLREKPYAEITVSELAARAQVVRKTFYRNFADKDEVLSTHLRTLSAAFLSRFRAAPPATYYEFAFLIFSYWQPHAPLMCFLQQHGLFFYFERAVDEAMPTVSGFFPCEPMPDPAFERYCTQYSAGGFRQLLISWLLSGAQEPPALMAEYFGRLRGGNAP